MTVIVAARTKTGVALAGDSRSVRGWTHSTKAAGKLWVADRWACGGAGLVRAIQCLHHHATLPKYRPDEHPDFERFTVTEVVPALRAAVKDRGVVKSDAGSENHQADLLLATGTQLVTIASDGAVMIDRAQRQAIGSGTPEALGFLGDTGPWTVRDVVEAVRRATLSDLGVAGPIWAVDTVGLAVEEVS